MTDGKVNAIACTSSTVYLGGDFTYVGPYTGCGAPIEVATGKLLSSFPRVDGEICASVADGSGGCYIGGSFIRLDTGASSKLAHIRSDGTLDPSNPAIDGKVKALALSGTTLYIGGEFTTVSAQLRRGIAAFETTGGTLTAWNCGGNGDVYAIAVSGSTIYLGGKFTQMGTKPRNNVAAVDAVSGIATNWNPNATGDYGNLKPYVNTLAVSGSASSGTIFVGGRFTQIGGKPRNSLAALDAANGNATNWNPSPYGNSFQIYEDHKYVDQYDPPSVSALSLSGSTVYAGGFFTRIGGKDRVCLAALDVLSTGAATSWNPTSDGNTDIFETIVDALIISGSTVYAGGDFTHIGGRDRNGLAALDSATGSATSWNPNIGIPGSGARVNTFSISGSTIYAGGNFASLGGVRRSRLAALNTATGAATTWDPNIGGLYGTVLALAVSGPTVYTGGYFESIGADARNNIGAVDAATGKATAWNPNAGGWVYCLDASNATTVYAGGEFGSMGGKPRGGIAAIDKITSTATGWDPNIHDYRKASPEGSVYAVAASGSTVYIGGDFTSVGLQTRNSIAAVDATTGKATAWNPGASGTVSAISMSGSTVFIGGVFNKAGGQGHIGVAAIDAGTGKANNWDPGLNGSVSSLYVSGSKIYAGGGNFTSVAGQKREYVVALDIPTGAAEDWNPRMQSPHDGDLKGICFAVCGSSLWLGGNFGSVAGLSRFNLAQFDIPLAVSPDILGFYR